MHRQSARRTAFPRDSRSTGRGPRREPTSECTAWHTWGEADTGGRMGGRRMEGGGQSPLRGDRFPPTRLEDSPTSPTRGEVRTRQRLTPLISPRSGVLVFTSPTEGEVKTKAAAPGPS